MTTEFGLWDQIRVDCGREWYLMLFVQEQLSHLRNDTPKPPHLRSLSKNVGSETLFLKVCHRLSLLPEPYYGTNLGRG